MERQFLGFFSTVVFGIVFCIFMVFPFLSFKTPHKQRLTRSEQIARDFQEFRKHPMNHFPPHYFPQKKEDPKSKDHSRKI